MPRSYRRPLHAGSWYEGSSHALSSQITAWLEQAATKKDEQHAQAIIAPHAGYVYCGHVLAHAYNRINKDRVNRVFLLGPSHNHYTESCVLSSASRYKTPAGDLIIDEDVYSALHESGMFEVMDLDTDEAEHSLELHTPFIEFVLRSSSDGFEVGHVPLVGERLTHLYPSWEELFARLLKTYLEDPSNLFVISSDFCHWGDRYGYKAYDSSQGPIWRYIEWLDKEGMRAIETGDPAVFRTYLQQTKNSICGRYPIGLFLNMLKQCESNYEISFVFYDQSTRCFSSTDTSVSYAAAVVRKKESNG